MTLSEDTGSSLTLSGEIAGANRPEPGRLPKPTWGADAQIQAGFSPANAVNAAIGLPIVLLCELSFLVSSLHMIKSFDISPRN
jgi:hypothetical protein